MAGAISGCVLNVNWTSLLPSAFIFQIFPPAGAFGDLDVGGLIRRVEPEHVLGHRCILRLAPVARNPIGTIRSD
jgi:hypothetical protein